jgi:hypothetical protein
MHVELTVIHEGQQYTLKGEATISRIGSLSNDDEFTRVTFADKTEDELIEWQNPFSLDDKCILETPTEEHEGLYKTRSRIDESPIIWLYKEKL